MKIAIGTDHRGFLHKEYIKQHMRNIEWIDVGTYDQERTDYPLFADKVVKLMLFEGIEAGVLLCASGGGMAIAANRYKYIYAVVAWNVEIARQSKQEDNANVLVIPSDFVSCEDTVAMIQEWLGQEFKDGRYGERIAMIDK
ncbi:MAG TPA: RpiB/LacA/LacB family sugar-phosphate isomerase [Candidatus Babeliales bacterium]|nr:RpiB/LacA/LacB family sugar-phosphate isomerase [Candidatus Babeliales bacterium]